MRLTVAQALVRFLAVQYSERDGVEQRLIAGCFGIFGHGNVAGVGQALLEQQEAMPFYHARNEQAMVHTAVGYARQKNRLRRSPAPSSIGPGATNMVTGAALATINRLPVLLLPGDVFATRAPGTVLQELEDPTSYTRHGQRHAAAGLASSGTRVERPEQLTPALLAAMRVLTDPAETGAVTLALPQDVQAEAFDWPDGAVREARLARPPAAPGARRARSSAAELLRAARKPLIVSGGGTIYAEATDALREFAEATGIGVGETQAGKGSLPYDHPQALGAIGATGTTAANAAAREADVILGVGTRWSDFTTASRVALQRRRHASSTSTSRPIDAFKHAGAAARRRRPARPRGAHRGARTRRSTTPANDWDAVVERAYTERHDAARAGRGDRRRQPRQRPARRRRLRGGHRCPATCTSSGARATRRATTSSTATRRWATRSPAASGSSWPRPTARSSCMVGDGSYLMMAQEIVTAVAEGIKLTIVLVQNHGYQSIGALSESVGSQRFGTAYRYRGTDDNLPVDLAANAASPRRPRASTRHTIDEFEAALREAAAAPTSRRVVQIHTDPMIGAPDSEAWWDVPVAEVAALESHAGRPRAVRARQAHPEAVPEPGRARPAVT